MNAESLFLNISIILVIAAVVSVVMRLLRQPLIVGYILSGLIVGPMLLDIAGGESGFGVLSSVGVSLLVFMVGLELKPSIITGLRKVVLKTAVLQMSVIGLTGIIAALLLDFGPLEAVIIGLCLAMSSTVIAVTIMQQKKEINRLYGQITVGILIVQDLVSASGKISLSTYSNGDGLINMALMLGRGVLFIVLIYLAASYVLPRLARVIEDSKELMMAVAIGWALGISALCIRLGYSAEIGALFAGMSLAGIPLGQNISARLRPLRDFFFIVFFISIGTSVTQNAVSDIWVSVLVFSVIVLVLKPLITMLLMGFQGYTKRASFKSSIALSQVSEFSLVFVAAALHHHYIGGAAYAAICLTAVICFVGSSYLIKFDDSLFVRLERRLRFFEHKVTRLEQKAATRSYPVMLFGYRKGGLEFMRTFKSLNKRFLVVDYDPEVAEVIERHHVDFVYGDALDTELLDEIQLASSKFVVCTISDFAVNEFLAGWLQDHNPSAIFIGSADSAYEAALLYAKDASYVMTPHIIGSEKISSFIKRTGFKKSDFEKFKERHMRYLESHFSNEPF